MFFILQLWNYWTNLEFWSIIESKIPCFFLTWGKRLNRVVYNYTALNLTITSQLLCSHIYYGLSYKWFLQKLHLLIHTTKDWKGPHSSMPCSMMSFCCLMTSYCSGWSVWDAGRLEDTVESRELTLSRRPASCSGSLSAPPSVFERFSWPATPKIKEDISITLKPIQSVSRNTSSAVVSNLFITGQCFTAARGLEMSDKCAR